MKLERTAQIQPSEDVFDDSDIEAIPAIREGLAELRAGRSLSADEVETRLKAQFQSR